MAMAGWCVLHPFSLIAKKGSDAGDFAKRVHEGVTRKRKLCFDVCESFSETLPGVNN